MALDNPIAKKAGSVIFVLLMSTSMIAGFVAFAPQEVQVGDQEIQVNGVEQVSAASSDFAWNYSASGWASASYYEGYLFSYDGSTNELYALDASSGVEQWRSSVGTQNLYYGPRPEVTQDGKVISAQNGEIYAFDYETGSQLWQNQSGQGHGASYTSPQYIPDENIVLQTYQYDEIAAYDADTGDRLWSVGSSTGPWSVEEFNHGVPAYSPTTGLAYITTGRGLVGIEPATGNIAFYTDTYDNATLPDATMSGVSPVPYEGNVYVSSSNSGIFRFDGLTGDIEMHTNPFTSADTDTTVTIYDDKLFAFNKGNGEMKAFGVTGDSLNEIWSTNTNLDVQGTTPRPSPTVANGRVYMAGWDRTSTYSKIVSLDVVDGSMRTEFHASSYTPDYYEATSPLIVDGKLFIGDNGGYMRAYNLQDTSATSDGARVGADVLNTYSTVPSFKALYYNEDTLITNYLDGKAANSFSGYSRARVAEDQMINDTVIVDPNGGPSSVTIHDVNPNTSDGRMLELSVDNSEGTATAHEFTINSTKENLDQINSIKIYKDGSLDTVFGVTNAFRDGGQVKTSLVDFTGYSVITINAQSGDQGVCSGNEIVVNDQGQILEVKDPDAVATCLEAGANLNDFAITADGGPVTVNATVNVTNVTTVNKTVIDETTIEVNNITNITNVTEITNITKAVNISETQLPEGSIGHRVYFDETIEVTDADTGSTETTTKYVSVVVPEGVEDITDADAYNATIADTTTNGDVIGTNGDVNFTKEVDVIGNQTVTVDDYQTVSTAYSNVSDVSIVGTSNVSAEKIAIVGDVYYPSVNVSQYDQYYNGSVVNRTVVEVRNVTNVTSFGWRNCDATFQRPGGENEKSTFWINKTKVTLTPDEILVTNTSGEDQTVQETYPWPVDGSVGIPVSDATVTANETAVTADTCVYAPGNDGATLPGSGNWEGFADVLFEGVPARVETLGFVDKQMKSTAGKDALSGVTVSPQFGTAIANVSLIDRGAADDFGKRVAEMTVDNDEGKVTMTIRNLDPNREYQIYRDGSEWDTKTTGSDGKLTFSEHRWSEHSYTVITGKSVAPAEEPVGDEDEDGGIKFGGGTEAPPTIVIIGVAGFALLLAGGYIYFRDQGPAKTNYRT